MQGNLSLTLKHFNMGPEMPVVLTLPDDAQRAYSARGEKPPPPNSGFA